MLRPGFAEFAHVIKYQGQGAVSAGESRVNADCSAESIDRFFRPAAHCESGAEIVVGPGFFRFGKRGKREKRSFFHNPGNRKPAKRQEGSAWQLCR